MATKILPVNNVIRVAAASTGNLTLSGAQTVDGVAVVANDLCLAKDQSAGAEKAIYLVSAGAWTLCDPGPSDGLLIEVLAGTVNADKTFKVTNSVTWGTGTPTFEDQGGGSGGVVTLTGTQTLTNKTLTAPVIGGGLTASGSAANTFAGSTGDFTLSTGDVAWSGAAGKKVTLTQGVATTGSPYALRVVGGAHTTLTASAEANDLHLNLARTVQFATGALTTQRAVLIQTPTYAFVGASTITNAASFAISGSPVAGTNATITNAYSLWVQAGASQLDGGLTVTGRDGLVVLTQPVATTGSPAALTVTGGAHTTLTASAEASDVVVNSTRTVQFATGALATQRAVRIMAPTYAFVGASTITNAATLAVSDAPSAGTNATITNSYALWVQSGMTRLDNGLTVTGRAALAVFTQAVAGSGSPTALLVTGAAHTTLTASAESVGANFNFSATKQFAAGALTTQREVLVQAPTYAFDGASTITNAATLAISGAPVAGTNATLTNSFALWVQGGGVSLGRATVSQGTNINTDVTINGASGVITTQAASTAAATIESGFTVNNTAVTATSVVICTIVGYSGAYVTNGYPILVVGAPGAGTFTIKVGNTHAANALSGTMKIHFAVL